jgi:hypothetical protein
MKVKRDARNFFIGLIPLQKVSEMLQVKDICQENKFYSIDSFKTGKTDKSKIINEKKVL